jgi:uncharacterized protein (DUF697 family)
LILFSSLIEKVTIMAKSNTSGPYQHGDAALKQFDLEGSVGVDVVLTNPSVAKDFRRLLADQTVQNWSQWATVAGFIPVPLLDVVTISGVQIKMIYDLCGVYDIPFEKRKVRAILSGLSGGGVTTVASAPLSASLIKNVPVVGTALAAVTQPAMAYATTYAIGTLFVRHFESNGTLAAMSVESLRAAYQEQVNAAKKKFFKKNTLTDPVDGLATPV